MSKKKLGRPKIKDKKVVWAFTINGSTKKAALKAKDKEEFDIQFRNLLIQAAFSQPDY